MEKATLGEPLSSVYACQDNIDVGFGDTVVIIGAGPIGCFHSKLAKLRGAKKVIQKEAALLIPIPTRYGTKEFLDAEEIANAICFLASPKASGINGVILFVDGGIDALLRSERF